MRRGKEARQGGSEGEEHGERQSLHIPLFACKSLLPPSSIFYAEALFAETISALGGVLRSLGAYLFYTHISFRKRTVRQTACATTAILRGRDKSAQGAHALR